MGAACAPRGLRCSKRCAVDGAPHIGLLLDNVPDFSMWSGAAAIAGTTIVGVNPTRRGEDLERDINHTECQLIVTETRHLELLDGLDLGAADGRILVIDGPAYADTLAPFADAPLPPVRIKPSDQIFLLFTSGTTGAPKAVVCSQERLDRVATTMAGTLGLVPGDVTYASMPLFHSNALFTAWSPTIAAGATLVLRRRFSASGVPPRRAQATAPPTSTTSASRWPTSSIRPSIPTTPTIRCNAGSATKATRPTCGVSKPASGARLIDGYGQTETGASINRVPGTPVGSLGKAPDAVKVIDPETGDECPPARFDGDGQLLNAEEATGEIVNSAAQGFEGYWKNEEAMRERYARRRVLDRRSRVPRRRTASSTSPAAPPTGSVSTARTSPRHRSSASSCAGSRSSSPPSTACPIRSSGTG